MQVETQDKHRGQQVQYDARKAPLTPEENTLVTDILTSKENRVVIDKFNIEMTTELIQCLKNLVWLNDDVVNFYMELLMVVLRSVAAALSLKQCFVDHILVLVGYTTLSTVPRSVEYTTAMY